MNPVLFRIKMVRTKAKVKQDQKAQQPESESDYGEADFDSTFNEHFTTPPSAKKYLGSQDTPTSPKAHALRRNPSPSKQATPAIKAAIAARSRLPLTTLEELTSTGESRSNIILKTLVVAYHRERRLQTILIHVMAPPNLASAQFFVALQWRPVLAASLVQGLLPRMPLRTTATILLFKEDSATRFRILPSTKDIPMSFLIPVLVQASNQDLDHHLQPPTGHLFMTKIHPKDQRYSTGPMPPPPPPRQPQSQVPFVGSSSKSSDVSDTAVEENRLYSMSDDDDDDDEDEEESDSDTPGRRGCISDVVKAEVDSLISGFNQASLEMTKKYQLTANYISRRMHPTARGPKRWNQLQSMLKDSEAERKKWVKGYKSGTTLTRKQFSNAYKSFMAGMGTAEADLYFQIHNRRTALDPEQSRQSRHRTFINATKAMKRIATQMEASVGMNTVFISVGDTMEEDHSLVAHYVSEPLQEHFVDTWGKTPEEMATHVKAGLYFNVSKEVLIEDMRLRVAAYDATKKVKTESREVIVTSTGSPSDKDLENTIRAAFIAQADKAGLNWPANVVLWMDMAKKNVNAGVQIVGWPHGMRIPGEFPDTGSGKKKSGFAHALKRNDKLIMQAAFENPQHPLEFLKLQTSAERQALKDGQLAWLVFAPPPHDSNQVRAKRLFYPDREDFGGPERLPSLAASAVSRKSKAGSSADAAPGPKMEKKPASMKPRKASKSSRRDPLDDIDEAMDQESYGTGPLRKRPREDSFDAEKMRTKRSRASAGDGITPSDPPSSIALAPASLPIESAAHPISQDQDLRPPAVPPVQQQATTSTLPQSGPTSNSQANTALFNGAPAYSGQSFPNPAVSCNAPPMYQNLNGASSYPVQPGPFQNPTGGGPFNGPGSTNGGPGFAPSFQTHNSIPNLFPMQNGGASFHQGGLSFNAQTGPGFPGQNSNGGSFTSQNNGSSFGHGQNQNSAPSFNPYHNGPPFNGPANMTVDPSQLYQQTGFGGQYPGYHAPGNSNGQPNWNQPNPSNGQSSNGAPHSSGAAHSSNGAPHSSGGPHSSNGAPPPSNGYNNPYQGVYQGAPQNSYAGTAQTGEAAPST
ncbi:hypothetical protein C8J56DRAFT_903766 [Mycena floridula]|nr:hypothetical protein C8J56DRAFT_903766 [Mycena floridula]